MRVMTWCSAALLLASAEAHALCRNDLQDLKPRIDRIKNLEPQRYLLASRWWGLALESEKVSEAECHTFLARARKALVEPLEAIAGCEGPNIYLPRCAAAREPVTGVQPQAGFGDNAGAAGGAAAGGRGAAGGGAANPAPFTPPGSVTAPHLSH